MTANDLTRIVQRMATERGGRLFRNNTGRLQAKDGRWVSFGLPPEGGSDLIGWMPGAVFCAIEIKVGRDKLTDKQAAFLEAVLVAGGVAGVVRSVEDAEQVLGLSPPAT